MEISECIHPLSKHWDQPKNTDIEIDVSHALMSEETFKKLYEYSMSIPTAVYAGKMWKAHNRLSDEWYLRWYEDGESGSETCYIKSRIILVIK